MMDSVVTRSVLQEELVNLEQRFDAKLDRMEERSDARFDEIGQRMDGFEQRMDGFEQRMDGFDQRMDRFEQRMDRLDERVTNGFADLSRQLSWELAHAINAGVEAISSQIRALSDMQLATETTTIEVRRDLDEHVADDSVRLRK